MSRWDWAVLVAWLTFIVSYGLYRGRGSNSVERYLLAGKSMPWYAMGLSIMATQASAVTFISTTGQGYVDGMRFVQFYFGLPIAMVILSATAVPIFHRAKVYTAYEYLEQRFDAKTRTLVSGIFLIQRGLGAGISLYAPAVVLSIVLGWPDQLTTVLMGVLVVSYTALGGIKALTWADVQQMALIFISLTISLVVAVRALPGDITMLDAMHLAGAAGRLRPIDLHLDFSNRYNVWSGLIGGGFLALAYFGTDQSQVQRYLSGKSIAQSRLSLLFNAMAKVPLQAFILFIGAMVFALSLFQLPPAIFHPLEAKKAEGAAGWNKIEAEYEKAFTERRTAAYGLAAVLRGAISGRNGTNLTGDAAAALRRFRTGQQQFEESRKAALQVVEQSKGDGKFDDTNYIFLSFVTHFLPVGLVGLLVAVIFSASMSSTSGEINSLATVSVIDVYRRYVVREATDAHYLKASKLLTVFWGAYAVAFAVFGARGFGALIERVNIVGSLFYGGMLGVFVLAFFFKQVHGTAAFWGVVAGEAAIFSANLFSGISFLWYNVIGCVIVVMTAVGLQSILGRKEA